MATRKIIGVQLHHPIKLADARRFGANLCSAVEAARRITDNPALLALHDHDQGVAGLDAFDLDRAAGMLVASAATVVARRRRVG